MALVAYVAHGFDGALWRDVAVYAYAGQRVAEGVPPYEGINNRSGPLAHLVPGVGVVLARIIGTDDLLTMRALFAVLSAGCVLLAYLVGRDVLGSRAAGIATAAALLCAEPFFSLATLGPREKTLLVLLTFAVLWTVAHQRWLMVGFLVSLATLTWQPLFIVLMPGVATALLLAERPKRLRASARVVVGGLAPLAVTLGMYAAAGSLRLFFEAFVLINLRYTQQPTFFSAAAGNVEDMVEAYGWSLAVFVVGALSLLTLVVLDAVREGGRGARDRPALLAAGVVLAGGLLWSVRAFNSAPDSFILLPGSALGIGGLVSVLAAKVPYRTTVAVTVAWTIAATSAAIVYSVSNRDHGLDHQRQEVDAVLNLLPPDARILSVAAPQALVLSNRRNPSRFQMVTHGLDAHLEDTWPGGLAGYRRWIEARRPALIVTTRGSGPSWLQPTLTGPYATVGHTSKWRWYARKDLGVGTLAAMRTALTTLEEPG